MKKKNSKGKHKQGESTTPLFNLIPCYNTINNSSSSFSKTQKKILIWGEEEVNDDKLSFFLIDVPIDNLKLKLPNHIDHSYFNHNTIHSHTTTPILAPLFTLTKSNHSPRPSFFNTFATVGSILFSIGGGYRDGLISTRDAKVSGSNVVYYIDMSEEYVSWKQAPSMVTYRRKPQVISVKGMLFVFGCLGKFPCPHKPKCCVLAEFFDPSTNKWSSITLPNYEDSLVVCSPNDEEKITAIVDYNIYQLDLVTKNWNCIAKLECTFTTEDVRQPVLVRNVLYWFMDNANALDIVNGEGFEGPVQDMSFQRVMRGWESRHENAKSNVDPTVLHLGGRYFCLLAYLPDLKEDNPNRIHCLTVKVSTTNSPYRHYQDVDMPEFFLGARVISCRSFPIDRRLNFLDSQIIVI